MSSKQVSAKDKKRNKRIDKRLHEQVNIKLFELKGESVVTVEHRCTVVDRSRNGLRLLGDEPLPIGERLDIIFHGGWGGPLTLSGVTRNLVPLDWEPGYFMDVELIQDRHVTAWWRQFH